jgi:hypothetical protein
VRIVAIAAIQRRLRIFDFLAQVVVQPVLVDRAASPGRVDGVEEQLRKSWEQCKKKKFETALKGGFFSGWP